MPAVLPEVFRVQLVVGAVELLGVAVVAAAVRGLPQRGMRALRGHMILDNYSTHKHESVKKWLAKHHHFCLHFIPPSNSWSNMVERDARDQTRPALAILSRKPDPSCRFQEAASHLRHRDKGPLVASCPRSCD